MYLESIVGPAAELHDAGLLVEGEVLHVHLAGGVVDGGRLPLHPPLVVQGRLCGQRHLKVPVRTGEKGEESAVLYTVQCTVVQEGRAWDKNDKNGTVWYVDLYQKLTGYLVECM